MDQCQKHRIIPTMIGTDPKRPMQSHDLILPALLLPEQVYYLLTRGTLNDSLSKDWP